MRPVSTAGLRASMTALPIRENVELAALTTFGVGGKARFFLDVEDEPSLKSALEWASSRGVAVTVLGGGSNVLVADLGFEGLVLRMRIRGIDSSVPAGDRDHIELRVGAGEELDAVIEQAVRLGFAGLECLSGIPGYIGATPIQNVGAYGQEISETITSVRVMDQKTMQVEELSKGACRFSYRNSVFKAELRNRYVVLSVRMTLTPGGPATVRYPELARALTSRGADVTSLAEVRKMVLGLRRSKSMVIDPDDPNRQSAGSFFMNPVISPSLANAVAEAAQKSSADAMPRFPAGEKVKLSAAWLIEHAGFHKGAHDGTVGISTRHALAIVNRGGATASQILNFAARVRGQVRDQLGVLLEHEPVLVGFTDQEARILEG